MMKYYRHFSVFKAFRQTALPGTEGIKGRFLLSIVVLFFSAVFFPALCSGDWDSIQDTKYIRASVDHEKIDETLTDFPILLYLSNICGADSSDVSELFQELSAYDDRKKMAVYTSGTQCYTEIEHWDSAAGEAWLWVRVPEIINDGDTELRIYYDKTKEPNTAYIGDTGETAARSVWDSSFIGVWHLGQNTGETACVPDSSGNVLYGTPGGLMTCDSVTDGITGKGAEFPGSGNSRIEIALPQNYDISVHTLEAFVYNYSATGDESGIIASSDSDDSARIGMADNVFGSPGWGAYTTFGDVLGPDDCIRGNALVSDTWMYLAYKFDGVFQMIYENGVPVSTKDQTDRLPSDLVSPLMIGNQYDTTYEFSGIIEEVRISDVPRSDAWIKASWHAVSDDLIRYVFPVPSPGINTLTVNPKGDGLSVVLDWTGYDEPAHGPAYYRIYAETSFFTDVSALTPITTVPAGQFTYTLGNLVRKTRYYFAVVPVGSDDNALTAAVAPVSAVPADITAPPDVTELRVGECYDTGLTFAWNPSADTHGDLAGYRVYFNGAAEGVVINPEQDFFEAPGLEPAKAYEIRITAFDNDENESAGTAETGVTLLENPENLLVTPENGRADLAWDAAVSPEYVQHYNIYFSETDFSDVSEMTSKAELTQTSGSLKYTGSSAPVAGLKTGTAYYFAVTAVNISGGEQKTVSTVSAAMLPETEVSGHITEDMTWTLAGSPYVVAGDVTVRHSTRGQAATGPVATLTMEPGITVRFRKGTGLYTGYHYYHWMPGHCYYHGALSAQGTEDSPIIFTSDEASPAPGDWKGITFLDWTSDDSTSLEHCVVEYAGCADDTDINNNAGIYCSVSSPRITHTAVRHSREHGIRLHSSSSRISSSVISNSGKAGIYISGTSEPVIGGEGTGNTIAFSGAGAVYCEDASSHPVITHNSISDYGGSFAVRTGAKMVLHDNTYSGEGIRAVEVLGELVTQDTTWNNEIPVYVVAGDVTVCHSTRGTAATGPVATLTVEPGITVRFRKGTGLYTGRHYHHWLPGHCYYHGALSARGTEASPIIFTSDEASPAPGDWKGITFQDWTGDDSAFLEHCVVEYGGRDNDDGNTYNDACIHLSGASPTIQYCTVRNSGSSGIYAYGGGCNGATLNCNNIKDNFYGIYTENNASFPIQNSNFLGNKNCGLCNGSSSVTLDAENNWWGDAAGPNSSSGDHISGNADSDPWLTEESGCIAVPPANSPPFAPSDPDPADGAVRVPVTDGGQPTDLVLTWAGRDPDPWDTLVFDVFFGDAADNLQKAAEGISDALLVMPGLAEGETYYWQVITYDGSGEQTAGPVWLFTTLGNPPDLLAESVTWDPESGIVPGQWVTFTAVIRNIGTGPVVDSFQTDFKIDGSVIKTVPVSTVIHVGESVTLSTAWTALAGSHTVEVVADSASEAVETSEDNNSLTGVLPDITDNAPPELISTDPDDGASVQEAQQIVITLSDRHGTVDDAASAGSIAVLDSSNQPIAGTVSEAGDVFTFMPAVPLPENGIYTVSLTAADMAGNTRDYSFSFAKDNLGPPAPEYYPVISPTYIPNQAVRGTRETFVSVLLNSGVIEGHTPGTAWKHTVALNRGENVFSLAAQDRAGNLSETVTFSIVYDDSPPPPVGTLTAVGQGDGTSVVLNWSGYDESVRGPVDFYRIYAETSDFTDVSELTEYSTADAGTFAFTAENLDPNRTYFFAVTASDITGRSDTSVTAVSVVTEDKVAPEGITGLLTRCSSDRIEFTWNPSADTHGDLAGYRVRFGSETEVTDLPPDQNSFEKTGLNHGEEYSVSIVAFDSTGNESTGVTVTGITMLLNPGNLSASAYDGYTVLTWDYPAESEYLKHFAVYVSETEFSDAGTMTPALTVSETSAEIEELTNGVTYWLAVTAVSISDCENTQVTTVSATPEADTEGPEITDVRVGDTEPEDDHHILFETGTVTLNAADISGTDRVEFYLDGLLICIDRTGTPGYSCEVDITGLEHGDYTLEIRAYDIPGNMSSEEYTVSVSPLPVYECFRDCDIQNTNNK